MGKRNAHTQTPQSEIIGKSESLLSRVRHVHPSSVVAGCRRNRRPITELRGKLWWRRWRRLHQIVGRAANCVQWDFRGRNSSLDVAAHHRNKRWRGGVQRVLLRVVVVMVLVLRELRRMVEIGCRRMVVGFGASHFGATVLGEMLCGQLGGFVLRGVWWEGGCGRGWGKRWGWGGEGGWWWGGGCFGGHFRFLGPLAGWTGWVAVLLFPLGAAVLEPDFDLKEWRIFLD